MLGFNEAQIREQLSSAVALRPQIEQLVDQLLERGIDNVLLVGSGGTYAQAWPYEYLARRFSKLPIRAVISRELIESGDAWLGENTLAVFMSVSGTTEDVLLAIDYVKSQGATTVSFTGVPESPIAQKVDHTLSSAPKTWPFDPQLLLLVGRIMNVRGEFPGYESLADELTALPDAVIDAAKAAEEQASAFAEAHKDTDYHFLIGGGPLWGFTYLYSMCILEEMQWLRTTRVNSAEFFHGSLELLEEDTSVIIFQGEDETRPLTDRAEAFAKRISKDVNVFDTRNYELKGFSPENRALIAPIVLDAVMGRVSKHLERVRDHSLDLRRYYRVMDY
ncbi:SIS domain-containing protein [Leucobacter tenebrionis]|uniref:SIS domain-containing protein n=1 Tax=Leucobacter tenebrionis TaxID=2873270 RepID=UPI001CA655B7|nr:SIS domain-containing protein [Leucobacter tenebrionis]QZY50951.1 SIS domain-containing protein [Leucobacter tenebrionis]